MSFAKSVWQAKSDESVTDVDNQLVYVRIVGLCCFCEMGIVKHFAIPGDLNVIIMPNEQLLLDSIGLSTHD